MVYIFLTLSEEDFDQLWNQLPDWDEDPTPCSNDLMDFAEALKTLGVKAKYSTDIAKIAIELIQNPARQTDAEAVLAVFVYAAMVDKDNFTALYPWVNFMRKGPKT